jgi:hypothetical protein|tara:strand:- start:547 stop:1218 length:672 start_codon:yes stop_codon:yes gene_type:complete
MELTDNVLQVLKNFASINPNIVVEPGNTIKTLSEGRNIFGKAQVDVDFPIKFGVYDLNEFLGVIGLVDSPRLSFEETHVNIGDASGRSKIKYFFTNTDHLTSPSKDIVMPSTEVSFTIDNSTLNQIKKAASALGHSELSIKANNGSISLSVFDSGNSTSNMFTIEVDGRYESDQFNFIISIPNLKLLSGEYDVEISAKLISHFINKTTGAEYWIALEKSSTYN